MMKRNAFTLAEILIVLAIIGVVAALTVPDLIQNTQNKEFAVALKKGISVLNQAVIRDIAINNNHLSTASATNILTRLNSNLRDSEVSGSTITLADGMTLTIGTWPAATLDVNGAAGPNDTSNQGLDRYNVTFNTATDSVACGDATCKNRLRGN